MAKVVVVAVVVMVRVVTNSFYFTIDQWGMRNIDEETKAQGGCAFCPKFHS